MAVVSSPLRVLGQARARGARPFLQQPGTMVGTPRTRGKGTGGSKMSSAKAAKKGKKMEPKRWPSSSLLLESVAAKGGKAKSPLLSVNAKPLLNSLTRVAIAMYTPVKPNQDGFKNMYLRLIGHDPSQPVPEAFNTILSTLTYSWHDTDPWAILGKSIWDHAEVGLDRAFYEFHREMSRLYTWTKPGHQGKIAPWKFPIEMLKPVVDAYRERVVVLRTQHIGLHIAKSQMREHLRKLQVEVVGPALLRVYREAGMPMPPWATDEKVGLARVYSFLAEHIPDGTELIKPLLTGVDPHEAEDDDTIDDDYIDDDEVDDSRVNLENVQPLTSESSQAGKESRAGSRAGGGRDDDSVGRMTFDEQLFPSSGGRESVHPLTALDLLVKTATASDALDDDGDEHLSSYS